ncbi:hypothetical protein NE865_00862 [Phthorimaea operculella]|nr:hypothetical protein NE865_00862 [Phthorimaea operculella]
MRLQQALAAWVSGASQTSARYCLGQTGSKQAILENPGVFLNPEQPLIAAVTITKEDVRRQEERGCAGDGEAPAADSSAPSPAAPSPLPPPPQPSPPPEPPLPIDTPLQLTIPPPSPEEDETNEVIPEDLSADSMVPLLSAADTTTE